MYSLTSKKMISYYLIYLIVGTVEWYLFIYFILLLSNQNSIILLLFLLWRLFFPDIVVQWISKRKQPIRIQVILLLSFLSWGATAGSILLDKEYVAAFLYVIALSFFRISYSKKISKHITDNQIDIFHYLQDYFNKISLLLAIVLRIFMVHYLLMQLFLLLALVVIVVLFVRKDERNLNINESGKWKKEYFKKLPVQMSLWLVLISSLEFFSIYLIKIGGFSDFIFIITFPINLLGFYLGERFILKLQNVSFLLLTFIQIILYIIFVTSTNELIFIGCLLFITMIFTILMCRVMVYSNWNSDELFTFRRSQTYLNGIGMILLGSLLYFSPIRVAFITFIIIVAVLIILIIRVNNRNLLTNKLL